MVGITTLVVSCLSTLILFLEHIYSIFIKSVVTALGSDSVHFKIVWATRKHRQAGTEVGTGPETTRK